MKRKVVKAFVGTVAVVAAVCVIALFTGCGAKETSGASYHAFMEKEK